jgi:hypothetical protein
VERFAWPRVAAQVLDAYHEAILTPERAGPLRRTAIRARARAANLEPQLPPRPPEGLPGAP